MTAATSIEFVPTDVERGMRAIHAIERAINHESRALERRHGISLAQLVALQQLARSPVTSLNELAKRTGTHQSSVSVVMKRLEEKGLVDRMKPDRRRVIYTLTEAGRRVVETAPLTTYQRLESTLADYWPAWQTALADMLGEWLADARIPL